MKTRNLRVKLGFSQTVLSLAVMAALSPAYAEDTELSEYLSPDVKSVTAGAGLTAGNKQNRALFGQYTGWSEHPEALLLDFQYVARDDATGFWTRASGRNLGQNDREIGFSQEKQGDWKYSIDYSEIVRRDPRVLNSAMQGAGSATPTVVGLAAPGTGTDHAFDLKRKGFTLEAAKWITPNLSLEASFKSEDKDGSRLFGIGGYCSNAISPICATANSTVGALFLIPEPVNSTTRQFEGKLTFFGDSFSLTGGYYGSFYNNSNTTLATNGIASVLGAGATNAALASNLGQPLALPPDNQAHQIYVSGTYAFAPTTRLTFKYAYTHATQDQGFGNLGTGNLNGELNTTLAQVGLTMRPMPKLSLNANVRWEEREDKTALGNYLTDASGLVYTNTPYSSKRLNAKAEATYQFSSAYRGTVGVDYAFVDRDHPVLTTYIPTTSLAAGREITNEVGVRAELRRAMSETFSGAVSLGHSERDGYRWYGVNPVTGAYGFMSYAAADKLTGTFPMTMLDRNRDSVKLMADWSPSEEFSLQFWVEDGRDSYSAPNSAGMRSNNNYSFNVDASWQVSEKWKLTAYASTGNQTLHMRQYTGYIADLDDRSDTFGFGAVGNLTGKLEVGGQFVYLKDRNSYKLDMNTASAVSDLPDVNYRATTLKLYGKYALDKMSDVRVDLIHQRVTFSDWAWGYGGAPFAFADNSTVTMQPTQNVTFVGASYGYRFK